MASHFFSTHGIFVTIDIRYECACSCSFKISKSIVLKFDTIHIYINAGYLTGKGIDYGEKNTTEAYLVEFPVGTIYSSFAIPIINDTISETYEEFIITIMKESLQFGIILNGDATANVIIIDNDSE